MKSGYGIIQIDFSTHEQKTPKSSDSGRIDGDPGVRSEKTGRRLSRRESFASICGRIRIQHAIQARQIFGQSGITPRNQGPSQAQPKKNGFDCPMLVKYQAIEGPFEPKSLRPGRREMKALTEFCENGAKAVAAETTRSKALLKLNQKNGPRFFRQAHRCGTVRKI